MSEFIKNIPKSKEKKKLLKNSNLLDEFEKISSSEEETI